MAAIESLPAVAREEVVQARLFRDSQLIFDRFRAIIDAMNEPPRWLVPVIRVALVLAFAGFTLIQLVGVPGIAWNDLQHHAGWKEVAFVTPLVIIFMGGMACLQVITVCTWKLLTLVETDEIFSGASARWVNGIVRAMYVGWALLACLAPYFYLVAEGDDAPGVLIIGLVLGLVATAVLGLMLVLRELLRRATTLRAEMDEVI